MDDGLEDQPDGISLSGLVEATSTGGDIVGTFLVYLTRPDNDASENNGKFAGIS